ncbi:MAG: potassium channel family protein [Candidatus Nanopelagicales bacterium]
MHVVILGCGRVGSLLADRLDEAGHAVAIVDQDPQSFRRLSTRFGGNTVKGIGFDRETLEKAGSERAHACAAVSSGDNTNILAARVARETYGVEHVVARIYDPRRAEVYQRLGIPTVATVSWTAGQIMRRLLPQGGLEEFRDASGHVVLTEMPAHPSWYGHAVSDIEVSTRTRVGFLSRLGAGLIPTADTVLQDGDLVHMLSTVDDVDRVQAVLAGDRDAALRIVRDKS